MPGARGILTPPLPNLWRVHPPLQTTSSSQMPPTLVCTVVVARTTLPATTTTTTTDTAHAFAAGLQSRLFGSCTDTQCSALRNHVLFGTSPLKDLNPWLTNTLHNWTSTRTTLHVVKPGMRNKLAVLGGAHTPTQQQHRWMGNYRCTIGCLVYMGSLGVAVPIATGHGARCLHCQRLAGCDWCSSAAASQPGAVQPGSGSTQLAKNGG